MLAFKRVRGRLIEGGHFQENGRYKQDMNRFQELGWPLTTGLANLIYDVILLISDAKSKAARHYGIIERR